MSNKLMNLNEELPIDFMFEKATNFRISPYQGKIYPNQTKRINIVFKPNNRGKFHDIIQLSFVNH